MADPRATPSIPLRAAIAFDESGDSAAALAGAWHALDCAPDDVAATAFLVRLLHREPDRADPARSAQLHAMLRDPALDPLLLAPAGWAALRKGGRFPAQDTSARAMAEWLEADCFARDLLTESYVTDPEVEHRLTQLRRWLLLEGRAGEFPLARQALVDQASRNGGAWLFDDAERGRLPGSPFAPAYLPAQPRAVAPAHASPVTQAVAGQYAAWPFPEWRRLMTPPGETLAGFCRSFGPEADLPEAPEILVAGCGTGRETLRLSRWAPGARITAIDLSAASLAIAEQRCAANGATHIRFVEHDLHDAAALGRRFDFISCRGVLHHLPDPERGWAALTGVLKPGGILRITLYSRIARLKVQAARARLADLLDRPATDDLLREARARLIQGPPTPLTRSPAFFYLGGVHDLLLHRHEDPFTVPRIRQAIESQGLAFLGFRFHTAADAARYRDEHPHDPWRRDYAAWAALERRDFHLFAQMYDFACRKPG